MLFPPQIVSGRPLTRLDSERFRPVRNTRAVAGEAQPQVNISHDGMTRYRVVQYSRSTTDHGKVGGQLQEI